MAEACAGWTDNAGERHACQFADERDDYEFDGEEYCRFHLPLGNRDEGGNADRDDDQLAAITDAIIGHIAAESTAAMEKPEEQRDELDFRGVVVPSLFDLNNQHVWALNMRGAQFHGNADFSQVRFHGHAHFSDAQFHRDARFISARFRGSADFSKARFHGHADFSEANFSREARFIAAQFQRSAHFRMALFNEHAYFSEARFQEDARFNKAQFHRDARFIAALFQKDARFNEAQFHRRTLFSEAQVHGYAWFRGSADPAKLAARQFNYTSFHRTHFEAAANFSNREFRDQTDFSGCKFAKAPDFHGSILHQNTAFGGIECFPDATSDGAHRAYRTLRQAMEAHRARAEEGMFYTLEQKALRHGMSRFGPAFLISVCYGLGSNYGFSVVRPLVCLVVGVFASTLLLLCVGMVLGGPCGAAADLTAMWNDGFLFSVRQTFLPFDGLRSKDAILAAYTFNPGGTGWLRAWSVVLTMFEALAALLLLLAVRWRYRR